jgi:hypothetical protein
MAGLGDIGCLPCRSAFDAMERAYRRWGGLQTGEAFSRRLAERSGEGTAEHGTARPGAGPSAGRSAGAPGLLGRVAAGEMFGWTWQDEFWVPMFQVDRDTLAVRPGPRRVLAELRGVFDGWSLGQWFVHPNPWLRGSRPLELLGARPGAVLLAARGDRVVAGH